MIGRAWWTGAIVAALLAVFLAQAVPGMSLFTATSDETSHLPSGYTYLETGDFRLNPQHPPLVKLLAALPLRFLEPRLDLEHPAWTSEPPDEWEFGRAFLYANDADRLLFWGRLPVVLLALVLGLHVWLWARDLFGRVAGIAALALFALCPTVIAHGHLVTLDVPLATFSTMALYGLRGWLLRGGSARLLATAGALGLALATKFSAVVFLASEIALIGLAVFLPARADLARAGEGRFPSPLALGDAAAHARAAVVGCAVLTGVAFLVVWAIYRFPTDPLFYWKGMLLVNQDHDPTYAAYLMGDFRVGGWWYYFPVAFLVKTPVPTLSLIALGIALFFAGRRARLGLDEALLVLPAAAFLVATAAMAENLGVRYLIPIFPLAWILASRGSSSPSWGCGSPPGPRASIRTTWPTSTRSRAAPREDRTGSTTRTSNGGRTSSASAPGWTRTGSRRSASSTRGTALPITTGSGTSR